eukprot:4798226-Ditylum_brightwellii.AAC.1
MSQPRTGIPSSFLQQNNLQEVLSHRHVNLNEPHTWYIGSGQISGVWVSPESLPSAVSLLPFGFGIGDHCAIMVDLPMSLLVGEELPSII